MAEWRWALLRLGHADREGRQAPRLPAERDAKAAAQRYCRRTGNAPCLHREGSLDAEARRRVVVQLRRRLRFMEGPCGWARVPHDAGYSPALAEDNPGRDAGRQG